MTAVPISIDGSVANTNIRAANTTDIPLLSDLICTSFRDVAERFNLTLENCPKHPSNCTDEWVKRDLARGVTFYILEDGDKPVGCVALEKASDDLCYLERLAVLPEHRQKGFGKTLVDHVFSQSKALGAKKVSIGIIANDDRLKRWYQKIGFDEGETKEYEHLPFSIMFMTHGL